MNNKELKIGNALYSFATVTVALNGEEKEIIPAFTHYSIKSKDFLENPIFVGLDKSKILPSIFTFTDASLFRNENTPLFDYYGTPIPAEIDEKFKVLVYLDKADNVNLIGILEEPLKSEVVKCDDVADAYNRVAASFLFSKCPNKDEWIGLAIPTTKENVLSQILEFAKDKKMSGTAAQAYFNLRYRVSSLQKAAITKVTPLEDAEHRSAEEAQRMFEVLASTFGAKCAGQTRYVKALNTSININSYNDVLYALSAMTEEQVSTIKDARCDERVQMLQSVISTILAQPKQLLA